MTKEARKIAAAFVAGKTLRMKRTVTDGDEVRLHGSRIAWTNEQGVVYVTLAGWPTPTTRDRVNAICDAFEADFRFCQKKGEQYLYYHKTCEMVPYGGAGEPIVGPLGRLALAA
jgi:hypothetical protein